MAESVLPRIRACLFDMDGLLIDSEDKYTQITNEVLAMYGRPCLPWSIKAQLQGRPQPEVPAPSPASKIFHDWAQLPITPEETAVKQSSLQAKYFPQCSPLPGVPTLLSNLVSTQSTDHPVHIALATSSHSKNFKLKSGHLTELFEVFPEVHRVLGDDPRIGKGRGKPLPDIYLLALETININLRSKGEVEVKPEECLVFEDAVPGVEAGRRAGMQVVWVPHPGLLEAYKGREDEVLAGRTGEHKENEKTPSEKEAEELQSWRLQGAGLPGNIGDGFGQLLSTLEDFPYEKYGIRIPGQQ
ncbi:HAD-superfamily hydrolase subfamily IA variant 3 [Penicillium argentinense]|uniref:HAD-superfamily hydrolase subfamily IA variant 3 n=1 Tax=Penicillium argentinense TaxID=1131581 RepID=A0A9W9FD30_9EURO|nr:HAD-superfamily hydrolase subfamily IA variant 3 [Penicillium argentinense]KAJ5097947.1 HAD-superfamily hydrolase subfamily IA variant 3 [Penicillium argentinense]